MREDAIAVCEIYYTFTRDFTEEVEEKAHRYFHRLGKRDMDSIYLNAVNCFSKYEPDIDKTDNGALFYPDMKAYVRCGNLSPRKLFELMQQDGCERVIIFGSGLRQDKEQPWEEFHSFEMHAPKAYILEALNKMRDEQMQMVCLAMEKTGINDIIPDVSVWPTQE